MSRPPDEDPPNTRVERLFDANEHRLTTPPPEAYGPEEITKVATPAPQRRDTPPPTVDSQILAMLQRIETKVDAIDRGLMAAWGELGAVRADMNLGFDTLRAIIQGDGSPTSRALAPRLELVAQQADSALAAITKLAPKVEDAATAALEASKLAQLAYDRIMHPEAHPSVNPASLGVTR